MLHILADAASMLVDLKHYWNQGTQPEIICKKI